MQKLRVGFTLIELSIVLLIIGLVAGGVLVGRDLIRTAELRKINSSALEIETAIQTYRTKFNCLAGDCPNATDFLGQYVPVNGGSPCGALKPANRSPGSATCNGNGDGRIDASPRYDFPSLSWAEGLAAWQQLAGAGLVPGSYTGSTVNGAWAFRPDMECPRILLGSNQCWLLFDSESYIAENIYTRIIDEETPGWLNGLLMGMYPVSSDGILTPREAQSYDSKFDDGSPVSGRVLVPMVSEYDWVNSVPACATSTGADATYSSMLPELRDQKLCNLLIRLN